MIQTLQHKDAKSLIWHQDQKKIERDYGPDTKIREEFSGTKNGQPTITWVDCQVKTEFLVLNLHDMVCHYVSIIVEGSLEVKLPTIWTDEKQRWEESEKRKRRRRRESLRRKKIQVREKVGKSRNTVFFQWFVAPEGRKVGSLKRRVRSQLARWEMKNCTPLWREAHFQVKTGSVKIAPQLRTTFRSCDVEKVHAVVARSTFRSQNVRNTPGLGPLLEC